MTIGFLLGAGFSKALHPSMPLVGDLLKEIKMPDDIPQSLHSDLEQMLSYLWTNYPWNTEMQHLKNKYSFLDLNQQIYIAITKAEFNSWTELLDNNPQRIISNRYDVESRAIWQAQLAGLLSDHKRFFAITMNYDTLLERLMMMNTNRNLIYPAPLQRLSGIWNQFEPIHSDASSNLNLFNFQGTIQPKLYKLHGSISWYSLDPLESNAPIYCMQMNKNYVVAENAMTHEIDDALTSIIIPPVADKSFLYNSKVLRSQWIGASHALQNCDTLYCVGYSLPISDLPIRLFLSQACVNIKHVKIVDLKEDNEHMERLTAMLPKDAEVEWIIGADAVEKMAFRLFEEEL